MYEKCEHCKHYSVDTSSSKVDWTELSHLVTLRNGTEKYPKNNFFRYYHARGLVNSKHNKKSMNLYGLKLNFWNHLKVKL